MVDLRVTCVSRGGGIKRHDAITHLGGPGWRWTQEQVMWAIKTKEHTFHTFEGNKRAEVAVVVVPGGEYLRTHADGEWRDDLLELPDCSV